MNMVKIKNYLHLLIVTMTVLMVTACDLEELTDDDDDVLVTSVSLGVPATLMVGETLQLTPNILPADATNTALTYSSSDETVVSVDANGLVTAVGAGNTSIVALNAASGMSGSVTIDVSEPDVEVTSVDLGASQTLEVGTTVTLVATVLPENSTNTSVVFSSSDNSIATVDQFGVVTTVGQGTAVITALNASSEVEGTVDIVVVVTVESIDLGSAIQLALEETAQINATILPNDATDMSLVFESADTDIASVDGSGLVTSVSVGTTTITATNLDSGVSSSVSVEVLPDFVSVTDVTLSIDDLVLDIDETYQITATIMPENASDMSLSYSTSDDSIATVSEGGVITGVAFGLATITATNDASGIASVIDLTVDSPIAGDVVFAQKWDYDNHSSDDHTTASGITYEHQSGGWEDTDGSAEIAGTEEDGLYRGEIAAAKDNAINLTYTVEDGDYLVTTHFAEIWIKAGRADGDEDIRSLNVNVEGQLVADGLNLYAEVGHAYAYDITESVSVSDGELNVDITAAATNGPKLSAILIQKSLSSIGDEDSDGVLNYLDQCLGTADGANVDDTGCVPPILLSDFEDGTLGNWANWWEDANGLTISTDAAKDGTYGVHWLSDGTNRTGISLSADNAPQEFGNGGSRKFRLTYDIKFNSDLFARNFFIVPALWGERIPKWHNQGVQGEWATVSIDFDETTFSDGSNAYIQLTTEGKVAIDAYIDNIKIVEVIE